jgi:peptidoglycan/xylan/chitin deacetylase (PgdA/CDA1 family)
MYYIDDGRKEIALTIDDGPSPIYTPQILRLLAKHRVTATFSMIGINVQAYPHIAREVAEAGHVIVNHTWTHADLALLRPVDVREQMFRATEEIHRVTGQLPGMFRAPYGAWSRTVFQRCAQLGMTPLDWSVDPRDWARPGVSSIVQNILRNTRTGSIILEHDGGGDRSQTVAALKIVLPRLLDDGYHFRAP